MMQKATEEKTQVSEGPVEDGWPTAEQFERGWWAVAPDTPRAIDIGFEYARMARENDGRSLFL